MKHKRLLRTILIASILLLPLFLDNSAFAALTNCTGSDSAVCQTNTDLIGGILKNVINILLFFAGTISVIVIIVGGIRYITSDGDPGSASKAKNTIIYALVGLVIAIMSFAIVNFILSRI